jgi:DNA-binding transcriptional MerR regulator
LANSKNELAVYSIGAVARMLDVPTSTLRAWEERYSIVRPTRSGGAQRLYSRAQVEHLRFVKAQIDAGATAADAHRLLAHELAGAPTPAVQVDPPALARPLILIVERDSYAADLEEYFLRTEGYEVAIALDPVQARLHFQERSPDVVVIDLLIAGGAGFRLCAEFAAKDTAQVLAVAAIDGAEEAIHLGAAGFLRKPIEALALVSTVRDLLGTSALTRQSRRSARPSR